MRGRRRLFGAARSLAAVICVLSAGLTGAAGAQTTSLNAYQAMIATDQVTAGTAVKPAAVGFSTRLTVTAAAEINTDPLTVMDLTLDHVRVNPTAYPVCTAATISAAGADGSCPHGALVGTGEIAGTVWSPAQPTVAGLTCEGILDVWNAGANHLTYFVHILSGHYCDGLQTGEIPAWTGFLRRSGPNLSIDMTLPAEDSVDLGQTGLFSGLTSFDVAFMRVSRQVGGQSVPFFGSTGCPGGHHHYAISLRADGIDAGQRSSLSGASAC